MRLEIGIKAHLALTARSEMPCKDASEHQVPESLQRIAEASLKHGEQTKDKLAASPTQQSSGVEL